MKILNGKLLAEKIKKQELKTRTQKLIKKNIFPKLKIFLVGKDIASQIYVQQKEKQGQQTGIIVETKKLSEKISEKELIQEIEKANKEKNIHGILIQLPLPKHINTQNVIEKIDPKKDVDGFTNENKGKLAQGETCYIPCTTKGIARLLEEAKINPQGKHIVILGRSNLVGKPTALYFINQGATVTICNSHTKNKKNFTQIADILIIAIGKPEKITKDEINPKTIIIDVGIHKKKNGTLCGDCKESIKSKAKAYTPVPGGIGPMTVISLIENVITAAEKN